MARMRLVSVRRLAEIRKMPIGDGKKCLHRRCWDHNAGWMGCQYEVIPTELVENALEVPLDEHTRNAR